MKAGNRWLRDGHLVMTATVGNKQVLLDKGLMEQIHHAPIPPRCFCGHPKEDHQGHDGGGFTPECSVWDCECEFYAGQGADQEPPSILSAETSRVNHTIVVSDMEEGASR